jgi:hypothetical protein
MRYNHNYYHTHYNTPTNDFLELILYTVVIENIATAIHHLSFFRPA